MSDRLSPDELALGLVVDNHEERRHWMVRLLEDAGYAVLLERTAAHAQDRARAAGPDLIIIAADLPDMAGVELCRALRGDARISSATPIFLTLPGSATRDQRLATLQAGAWECIAPPHDPDEILLKANTFVRSKREADSARLQGLIDPPTGLYNRQGLARRARELASQAFRDHGAIACVALAIDVAAVGLAPADMPERGVHLMQSAARRSDVIGRLGPTEFAILAPGTDAPGARRLAERLAGALNIARAPAPYATPLGVRVGYEAVSNVGYAPVEPVELLVRASTALRTGKAEAGGWIRRFDADSVPVGQAAG